VNRAVRMLDLLGRAASLLLGDNPEDADAPDARHVLEALGYATAAELPARVDKLDLERVHRARLLNAASRFARLFQLAAPDAPGLICFGAEFDPAMADPMHEGSPLVGVSGIGLSLQEAFQGCVGEGVEYLSQLQTAGDLLLPSSANHQVAQTAGETSQFLNTWSSYRLSRDAKPWSHRATRCTGGTMRGRSTVHAGDRISRRYIVGCRSPARTPGIDRTGRSQSLVAGWQTWSNDLATA
jgi:ribosomal protein S12 methylthiotransferase accessory factor